MKYLSLLFVSFILLQISSLAQAPDTMWTKTFGGSEIDGGNSVRQTTDGGYIIAGVTASFGAGSQDNCLIKTDEYGDTMWTKTFGGAGFDFGGFDVRQTSDGGYILVGVTWSSGSGGSDVYLVRTDCNGDTIWTKTFGGIENEIGHSVQQTSNGGYILVGVTWSSGSGGSDVYLVRTDCNGDTIWTKTFGGGQGDFGTSVYQTVNGGYIIVGSTESFGAGNWDVWLIRTNVDGDTLWTRTYGGSQRDVGTSVQQTTDGGYIIVGSTDSFGGREDFWLIKTDSNGDTLWTKTFVGEGASVQQTSDGGYILVGTSGVYFVRTDCNGDTIWTKRLSGSERDEGHSVRQTTDGGYIAVGSTKSFGAGNWDVWLIKLEPDSPSVIENYDNLIPSNFSICQNYPNPFNPSTKIRYSIPQSSNVVIKVFDVLGNEIETLVNEEKPKGIYEITWYAERLPSGIYFYQLQTDEFIETKKMILLK